MDSADCKDDGANANKCPLDQNKSGLRKEKGDALVTEDDLVIDVDCNGEDDGGGNENGDVKEEKMCRICHLGSDCFSQTSDLIQLGCRCRNDLGNAHRCCAELWFATKGSRYCEICGGIATNISGVVDDGLLHVRNNASETSQSDIPEQHRSKPLCTFVAAIIIMVLAIHWIFHEKPHQNVS